ncbi:T9SS type A sorting domain-containing protein [Flavobacterium piscis]|uniref:Endonuclease/exonuclease/phosphatase family metal-dependent hydrolase n=1 Tax=Flavobacterium piscis TaxID=1114874 RepID=A0ABU1YAZ3_9FLAO|nr:T9SS type A sorting domain-containing protein [Flavobacterium piscis]MDR7211399.1 endonuclease/exonuclease/phosphatase family metal-dependent hydrolase [Flavobacterium piscis]
MKNIYAARYLMAFFSFFYCSLSLIAQTSPAPQPLPYTQDFSFAASLTTYPDGFQGWTASTSPESAFNTNAVLVADRSLIANSTAGTNSGNFHNYDGKIGFLNTGSLDLTIGFAFSTIGQTAIQVQYDAMTIRNPYDIPPTTTNTRINEMVLQYRVGTTTPFTSLLSTVYSNNDTKQITAVTTPQNLHTIKVTLPVECENQSVVQIRWISRQVSGSGSRPSFAIDNIDIRSDIVAPISETGFPKADNILSDSFEFSNKIDEPGKTYFVLLPSGSTTPTITQIKTGLDANNSAALESGFLDITDNSQIYVKIFSGLSLNTAYSVFSVSEDLHGNIQSTVNKIEVTTSSVVIPSLSTSVAALDLGFSETNFASDTFSYQIQGKNLTHDVIVTAPANFTVSKDNTNFLSVVTYDVTDFASNATPTVYVRFLPTATAVFSGQLTHESTAAATKNVALSGTGINPYVQGFNDVNVLTNSGWTQYNVAGNVNAWTSTTVARNVHSGTGAVLMNGFSESGASKDWLISPKLHLDNFGQFPLLSFYSRKFYAGPELKLMVSVDYDGNSNPETATWVELNGDFPVETGTYKPSQYIDLGAYKTSHTYLAWVYETTSGGTNNAAEWSLDDIAITNESGYVASNPNLDFGDVSPNTISASTSFIFKANGYNDITITAPADYQVSLDNSSFQSNVLVNTADASAGKTIYVRFTPSVKALTISGALTVTGTSLNKQIGTLTGSSLPKADTFDVVTYNLEFFGTDVKDTGGFEFGPIDDALQIENVAKVMNKLNADVYVVQEVSDDPSIDLLIQKININGKTFDKTISTSWSYSFNAADPNFPPQKLVVLYNTQTTTVKKTRVMFKKLYDEVRAGTTTLPNYPGGNGASFFSSGRLPYMVQIETNIGGVTKEINLINIHARANSGSDISRYNMRKYDVQLLKDSLDVHYPNSNLMILGDFNDDVKASVIEPNPSSYEAFVNDTSNYNALTLGISQAGAYSYYLGSQGFLDHIVISNELTDEYIPNSIAVYDPRTDITNYTTTTSDHGPVIARFELKEDNLGTIDFENNSGFAVSIFPNPATDVASMFVKSGTEKNLKLRLYNINGHLIGKPIDVVGTEGVSITGIPVSYLQSGIYIYTLTENNKVVFRGKILKK